MLDAPSSPPPIRYNRRGMKRLRKWVEKREAARKAEIAEAEAKKEMEALQVKAKPPRLHCYGRRVDPTIPERRLGTVRWVKDVGVTARGSGDERRLVAFVVMEDGRLLRDVELDLRNVAASSLPAYLRPQAYAQVAALPRHPVLGTLLRHRLREGRFDDRTFQNRLGRFRGKKGITAVIRNAINEIRFEGVVSRPVEQRRDSDPPAKVRQNEARVTLSHRPPGDAKRVTVTFSFRGAVAKQVLALEVGERVAIVGRIATDDRSRVFLGVSFAHVEKTVERAGLGNTDSVIEALL